MKASELRIGSLTDVINRSGKIHLPTGIVLRVVAIGITDVMCVPNEIPTYKATSDIIITIPIKDLNPIPLTEEWLLKHTDFKPYVGWDDMIFWRLPNFKINDFELLDTALGYMTTNDKLVKDVHTLQNCYYFHALTNEELTIKEL